MVRRDESTTMRNGNQQRTYSPPELIRYGNVRQLTEWGYDRHWPDHKDDDWWW